jgi:WD40 repeat protein
VSHRPSGTSTDVMAVKQRHKEGVSRVESSGIRFRPEPSVWIGQGHTGSVNAMAFSPSGSLLATAGSDMTIRLWDVTNYSEISSLVGHTGGINSVVFDPSGHLLASVGGDNTVRVWVVSTGQCRHILEGHILKRPNLYQPDAYGAVFSPDGQRLAVMSRGERHMVRVWDVTTGNEIQREMMERKPMALCFGPGGKIVIVGTNLRLLDEGWDLWRGELAKLEQSESFQGSLPRCMAIAPNCESTAIGSYNRGIASIDLRESTPSGNVRRIVGHTDRIISLSFSSDGRMLASGGADNTARIWDVDEGREHMVINGPTDPSPNIAPHIGAVAFSPDGTLLAIGGVLGASLWDVATGTIVGTLTHRAYSERDNEVVAASRSGRYVACTTRRNDVVLWDVLSGRPLCTLEGHTRPVNSVSFSPDERQVVTASNDGTVRRWLTTTGRELSDPIRYKTVVTDARFAPEGNRVVICKPHDLFILDAGNWRVSKVLKDCGKWPKQPQFSPDGSLVAAGVLNSVKHRDEPKGNFSYLRDAMGFKAVIRLWDARTGNHLLDFGGLKAPVNSVAFSPDGCLLASGIGAYPRTNYHFPTVPYGCEVRVWDLATRKLLWAADDQGSPVRSVSFSPDGRFLVSAAGEGQHVKLWEAKTGRPVHTLQAGPEGVSSFCFSRAQGSLATVSTDGALRLWDTDSGALRATLVSDGDGDWVTFLPDGYYCSSWRGVRKVVFRVGLRAFPFEQFDLIFNRPYRVMRQLGCRDETLLTAARKAYDSRLARMGMRDEDIVSDMHIPNITVVREGIPVVSHDRNVLLRVRAWDETRPLERLMAWVNDVPILYDTNSDTPGLWLGGFSVKDIRQRIPVLLAVGMNRIQVSVFNSDGAESLRETVRVKCVEKKESKPRLWIVAVGVSRYQNAVYNLRYAAKDANDIASIFSVRDPSRDFNERYKDIHVHKILDEDATKENILAAKQFLNRSSVDDTVIVFFAGHGLLDNNLKYFFGTYDVDSMWPHRRGVGFDALESLLSNIKARRKLLLLDTCHAGELGPGTIPQPSRTLANKEARELGATVTARSFGENRALKLVEQIFEKRPLVHTAEFLQEEYLADLRRGTGATIIAACSGEEYSIAGQGWANGVFTHAVLESLRDIRGDTDIDGKLTVSELRYYVRKRVLDLTNGMQHPVLRRENLADDFIIVGKRIAP